MGIVTALSATGVAAGLAVTGIGVHAAAASSPASPTSSVSSSATSATITLPSSSVLGQKVTRFCGRVPNLQTRAAKAQTRLTGNADTKGSIAWLQAKEAAQSKKGHTEVANRLGKAVQRRTKRLAKLPTAQSTLAQAKTQCSDLDLPSSASGQ